VNEKELVELLQRHALLTPDQVRSEEFRITRVDRRNRNYIIRAAGARELFVKLGSAAGASGSMAQEAAVYELLAEPSIAERVGEHLIRFLGHDTAAHVVMLEALAGAEDLHGYHLRTGHFSARLASKLGACLGALHRATRPLAQRPPANCSVGAVRPWVFELPCPEVGLLREASATNLKVLRLLQKESSFERELTKLAADWNTTSLIHGDVKLANCLTQRAGRARRAWRLKLVDWEFAGFGDPRWDVASVFSSYLALWVWSIPMPRPERPDLLVDVAQFPLADVRRTLVTFFESYVAALEPRTSLTAAWLLATVRMAGAHLVQTAYEYASMANELTAPILTLVQLALNVLERPERAAAELFGIGVPALQASVQAELAGA
jgi:Ser/Thr protein kinase RdoA (MazF antagonist)